MNKSHFKLGDRVKIYGDYHWAKGAFGTVRMPPDMVVELSAPDIWQGHWQSVQGLKKSFLNYWIEFDETHRDADGDGPYGSSMIDEEYLTIFSDNL